MAGNIEIMENLMASLDDIPVIEVSLSNPTYKGERGQDGAQGPKGDQGEKGLTGDPGVWIGKEEPVDESIQIWIDELTSTDMSGYLTKETLNSELSEITLSNIEIERLLGGHV